MDNTDEPATVPRSESLPCRWYNMVMDDLMEPSTGVGSVATNDWVVVVSLDSLLNKSSSLA